MADLPQWISVDQIKADIRRRFGKSDQDDLQARLARLTAFDVDWRPERINWKKRLDSLCSLFDGKLGETLSMFKAIKRMSADVAAYESDENKERPQMPAIFSVGPFSSETAATALFVESREFFAKLRDTIKAWADMAAVRIKAHNAECEPIKREVLMTVQQAIDRAVAKKSETIARLEDKLDAERDKVDREKGESQGKLAAERKQLEREKVDLQAKLEAHREKSEKEHAEILAKLLAEFKAQRQADRQKAAEREQEIKSKAQDEALELVATILKGQQFAEIELAFEKNARQQLLKSIANYTVTHSLGQPST